MLNLLLRSKGALLRMKLSNSFWPLLDHMGHYISHVNITDMSRVELSYLLNESTLEQSRGVAEIF
jgi:hypothetical protein